jgi:hypothetical protein
MTQKPNISRTLVIFSFAILAIVIVAFQPFLPVKNLTTAPLLIPASKFYFGALSSLGILGWAATGTICLATYFILVSNRDKKTRNFFLFSGLFTLFLLFDDLFMMHAVVFPKYLNINEKVLLAIYPTLSAFMLINYRGRIAGSSYIRLFMAFGFLGLSNVVEVVYPNVNGLNRIFEDGFKFLGIVAWAIYFFDTAFTVFNYEFRRPVNRMIPKAINQERTASEFSSLKMHSKKNTA